MMEFIIYMVENTVGKGENAGYQHFLLSPRYFFVSIGTTKNYTLKGFTKNFLNGQYNH